MQIQIYSFNKNFLKLIFIISSLDLSPSYLSFSTAEATLSMRNDHSIFHYSLGFWGLAVRNRNVDHFQYNYLDNNLRSVELECATENICNPLVTSQEIVIVLFSISFCPLTLPEGEKFEKQQNKTN